MDNRRSKRYSLPGFLGHFAPPPVWRLPVAVALGVFVGLGLLLLHASRATSYISEDPSVCINCHVMVPQFTAYQHGAHRGVATCNDCHLPHANIVSKFIAKGRLGIRHATVYATRREPQVIRATRATQRIVQKNCLRCHEKLVETVPMVDAAMSGSWREGGGRCWECHREVGHGAMSGLSSAPYALSPMEAPRVPVWLEALIAPDQHESK